MTGRSAVRLARLLWEQEVPGSNPGAPTDLDTESIEMFYSRAPVFLFIPMRKNWTQGKVCPNANGLGYDFIASSVFMTKDT